MGGILGRCSSPVNFSRVFKAGSRGLWLWARPTPPSYCVAGRHSTPDTLRLTGFRRPPRSSGVQTPVALPILSFRRPPMAWSTATWTRTNVNASPSWNRLLRRRPRAGRVRGSQFAIGCTGRPRPLSRPSRRCSRPKPRASLCARSHVNSAYTATRSASTPAPRPSRPIDPSTVAPADHINQPPTARTDKFPFHLN